MTSSDLRERGKTWARLIADAVVMACLTTLYVLSDSPALKTAAWIGGVFVMVETIADAWRLLAARRDAEANE